MTITEAKLNRLDAFDVCESGFRIGVQKICGEFRSTIKRTKPDGILIDFFESKTHRSISGASHWINKRLKEITEGVINKPK